MANGSESEETEAKHKAHTTSQRSLCIMYLCDSVHSQFLALGCLGQDVPVTETTTQPSIGLGHAREAIERAADIEALVVDIVHVLVKVLLLDVSLFVPLESSVLVLDELVVPLLVHELLVELV